MAFYSQRLLKIAIFDNSFEKLDIKVACSEWIELTSYAVHNGTCVCKQNGLDTIYVFVNKKTGKELHVGSTCREHFYAYDLVA